MSNFTKDSRIELDKSWPWERLRQCTCQIFCRGAFTPDSGSKIVFGILTEKTKQRKKRGEGGIVAIVEVHSGSLRTNVLFLFLFEQHFGIRDLVALIRV